jgi:inorganic pyrophosphatase
LRGRKNILLQDDGDPIDIMVVHDATTFPGVVIICRPIGVLQIEQRSKGKSERNDRLFAVPLNSHAAQTLEDVRALSRPMLLELEKFFIATDELEDKKLNVLGWDGPQAALNAIEDAARAFKKT